MFGSLNHSIHLVTLNKVNLNKVYHERNGLYQLGFLFPNCFDYQTTAREIQVNSNNIGYLICNRLTVS